MMKSIYSSVVVAVTALLFGTAYAQDSNLEKNLKGLLPSNMPIESVQETPMEGVYEVVAGGQPLYVYSAGKFLMIGDVYDAESRVNLGEQKKNQQMSEAIKSVPEEEMIVLGDNSDRYVVVFTDTDCGYCQRFHRNVAELNERGLQVRYLMFPRAGLESDSYNEAVSVWCADDQGRAMTVAKSGGMVEEKNCENPVAAQYELGQQIGIRGTPTMILDNGEVIPGYLPPAQLLSRAGIGES